MTIDINTGSSHIIISGIKRLVAQDFGRVTVDLTGDGIAHCLYFDHKPIVAEVGTIPERFLPSDTPKADAILRASL